MKTTTLLKISVETSKVIYDHNELPQKPRKHGHAENPGRKLTLLFKVFGLGFFPLPYRRHFIIILYCRPNVVI